ncbi:sugar ABC transporter ATP-binding protein [uncultured Anaerotruncus sp.]|uniref:sugar ABC transporter ATP-binding protein n=1 Tax=uncultured Anaerotruncus sp. TaxID=905011 RepID=UPI00280A4E01|nr:sugar ABC transporter ATP-binding protein [uncultured Anaerotruncus sp.]
MSSQPLLQLDNIHKSFYGAEVLHGVNLDLCPGEVLGLVGENGAGKSTLMSILGGVYGFDSGTMRLGGEVYTPATPNDATRAGIAFIRQEFSLFSNLTVAENLFVDRFPRRGLSVDYKKMEERAQVYIDLFRLDISPRTKVESLPMGVRQIVEISKALEKDAKIIIFDEPTTSLSPKEKEELFEVIGGLKARDVSIIYISHILEDVMRLCDRTTVLRDGNSVGTFQNSALDKREIIRLMVGREMNQVYPTIDKEIGEPIYEVREFVRGGSRSPVSLTIRKGEIVGMFGLMGAGRTELLGALFGADPSEGGEILVRGKPLARPTPARCIREGIAYVTENRRQEGLVMPKTIEENATMVVLDRMTGALGVVDRGREKKTALDLVKKLTVKTTDPQRQFVKNLSGGNQQKVVIAKWVASEPSVFFMDEPTRGVDVGAKYEIYTYINELAREGCGVLLVSSEMEEVMGICDRILVMYRDRIVADIPKAAFDQERIIQYALEGGIPDAG